jgi:hypothetical protein
MPFLKKYRLLSAMLGFSLLVANVPAAERARVARETDLKAVFVLNFARFVEWPPDALADPGVPFVIGIIGEDPFGANLDGIVANETVNGRSIVVRRFHEVREISNCHILFINESERPRLSRILEFVSGKSILTVGDTDAFSASGGMVRFVVVQNKLKIRINPAAAKASHLTISSMLLRQAEIVEPASH